MNLLSISHMLAASLWAANKKKSDWHRWWWYSRWYNNSIKPVCTTRSHLQLIPANTLTAEFLY